MFAKPSDSASVIGRRSVLPTSTAMTRSASSAAIADGQVVDHAAVDAAADRRRVRAGNSPAARTTRRPRRARRRRCRPGAPQMTGAPRSRSTVFTSSGVGRSANVPSRHDGAHQVAQRLLEIDRRRPHALHQHSEMIDSEQVAPPQRLRARRAARRSTCRRPAPPASIAPMLVPAYDVGTIPRSSSACMTPMCANPFMPPPPSTRAMRRSRGGVGTELGVDGVRLMCEISAAS